LVHTYVYFLEHIFAKKNAKSNLAENILRSGSGSGSGHDVFKSMIQFRSKMVRIRNNGKHGQSISRGLFHPSIGRVPLLWVVLAEYDERRNGGKQSANNLYKLATPPQTMYCMNSVSESMVAET
jgi:hypothetical protein